MSLYEIGYWLALIATFFMLWKVIWAGMRSPALLLTWIWIVSAMGMYFYVYMSVAVRFSAHEVLDDRSLFIGQLVPMLCIAAMQWAWVRRFKKTSLPAESRPKPTGRLMLPLDVIIRSPGFFWCGVLLIVLGAIGHLYTRTAASALSLGG